MRFSDDPKLEKGRAFSRAAALDGAIFHPNLNWFLSAAHDDATIDESVAIASDFGQRNVSSHKNEILKR